MAGSLDRRGRNRGLTARGGRPCGGFRETFLQECRSQVGGGLFPLAAATLFLLAVLAMGVESTPLGIVSAQYVLAIPAAFWSVALVATAMARVPCTQSGDRRRLQLLFGRVAGGALAAFLCSCAALLGTLAGAAAPWLDPARLEPFSLEPYWQALWTVAAPNAFIACGLACVVAVHVRGVYPACAAALVLLSLVASAGVVADPDTLAWLDPTGTVAFLQAGPVRVPHEPARVAGRRAGVARRGRMAFPAANRTGKYGPAPCPFFSGAGGGRMGLSRRLDRKTRRRRGSLAGVAMGRPRRWCRREPAPPGAARGDRTGGRPRVPRPGFPPGRVHREAGRGALLHGGGTVDPGWRGRARLRVGRF